MNHIRTSFLLLAAAALVLAAPLGVCANDLDAGFSVKAVLPENQRDPDAAYFDLLLPAGQEQVLTLLAENPNDYAITLTVQTITASTNRNGIINYSVPGMMDESLPLSFAQIAQPEQQTIMMPPFSTQEIRVAVSMPEESLEGMLLGAVRVVRELEEEELQQETGVLNQYSYIIAVRLVQQNEPFQQQAEFTLGDIEMELVNHKAAIVAPIHNTRPMLVKGASVQVGIYADGAQQPIIEKWLERVDLAPNSVFPMTLIDQEGYGFAPGNYTAVVLVQHQGKEWAFGQDFTIHRQQAADINDNAVNQYQHKQEQPQTTPVAGVLLGSGCALAIAGWYFKRRLPARRGQQQK